MQDVIRGLHHVTATVDGPQEDLDCYLRALGLRLVKKTVNFDNHNVYHFYYGNGEGTPGTLWTTFPYRGWGVRPGIQGAGQITTTTLSVPRGTVPWWRTRLDDFGFESEGSAPFADDALTFHDPSGLVIELREGDDDRVPWVADGFDEQTAIRGLHAVTLSVRDPDASILFLTEVLGWRVVAQDGPRTRMAVADDRPGHRIEIRHAPDAPDAVNGLGTVHHVAMAIDDEAAQARARRALLDLGVGVTEVRDRQYFKSIYFREPGGVLYEIATLPPGFTVDEPLESLGRGLKLPPWEERARAEIERGLPVVEY